MAKQTDIALALAALVSVTGRPLAVEKSPLGSALLLTLRPVDLDPHETGTRVSTLGSTKGDVLQALLLMAIGARLANHVEGA